ncbi:DUF447 domain-containing protein [Methanohalophilus portucalensis]|uniref:DUF447 family protein n=2 Tax=Methanohalophilus portucalensis TaxID=39664 RepID=A0A1L9C717_9EURY|nr:DUF447 domain-containing protein [Methanohalophilus portucalensis]ATU08906.1 hypothetical protein BKM01_09070 [Methanohalophilus portucalensis]OJH50312.1 hypothetical protein MPF_0100 [Methanohalophilus portucalensis FDF-1]RNI11248.1 DUF447 family protein [Methanohalophilus portucalensis FDF-1]SMH28895.1 hypothetical protein SAMN06264941_0102 [Methanohalophilus portucalensis FDF-1]
MEVSELDKYGICDGISEIILTSGIKNPNAAPIGLIRKDNKVFIRLYKGSTTYENVKQDEIFAANVTCNPLLFVKSTFSNLENENFKYYHLNSTKIPLLKNSASSVIFRCGEIKHTEQAMTAEIIPMNAMANDYRPRAINRGLTAVIEAAVHATRYELTRNSDFLDLIDRCLETTYKCGGQREKDAAEILLNEIDEIKKRVAGGKDTE